MPRSRKPFGKVKRERREAIVPLTPEQALRKIDRSFDEAVHQAYVALKEVTDHDRYKEVPDAIRGIVEGAMVSLTALVEEDGGQEAFRQASPALRQLLHVCLDATSALDQPKSQ